MDTIFVYHYAPPDSYWTAQRDGCCGVGYTRPEAVRDLERQLDELESTIILIAEE